VIYLEAGAATPDELTVRLVFPDGSEHDFTVKTLKLLDHDVDELAGRGFTPLLPFYILKLRKAAKRAKTDTEKREVEEGFKELGLKLKDAIEADGGSISGEDTVTLLERLYGLVEYTGRGYRTVEVKTMLNNSLKGYGQVLAEQSRLEGRLEGEQKGRLEGKLETAMNALKIGIPVQQAAQITGISEGELLKQLNKPQQ
jgi:hypothetical protein